jgi:hypothetical protein
MASLATNFNNPCAIKHNKINVLRDNALGQNDSRPSDEKSVGRVSMYLKARVRPQRLGAIEPMAMLRGQPRNQAVP